MSIRLLVVEDDNDILLSVQELLQAHGYTVDCAANGALALQLLENARSLPALIILDYAMPEMDGPAFRAAQERNARIAAIPILLMTADATPDIKQIKIGARGHIKKPLDLDKFLTAIRTTLNYPRR